MPAPIYWTKKRCIDAIREWAIQNGGLPPRKIDWQNATVDHPCHATVSRRFGTWTFALMLAGYKTRQNSAYWTPARIRLAVRWWAATHGSPPKAPDWKKAKPEHPCYRTVIGRCGSWNAAITGAGFAARTSGGQAVWTHREIVEAIRRFAAIHGRVPTSIEWNQPSAEWPHLATIKRRFRTWNNAIRVAGFVPRIQGEILPKTDKVAA